MTNKEMFLSHNKKTQDQMADEILFLAKSNPFLPDIEILQTYFKYINGLHLMGHQYIKKSILMKEVLKLIETLLNNQENLLLELLKHQPQKESFIKEKCINDIKEIQKRLTNKLPIVIKYEQEME